MSALPDFNRFLRSGATIPMIKDMVGVIELKPVGELRMTTGRLVAGDPSSTDLEPLAQTIPAGYYPVYTVVATPAPPADPGWARVLGAMLKITAQPPVTWKLATWPGQHTETLNEGEVFCYGVDAGLGCFMDEAAARIQSKNLDDDIDEYWDRQLDKLSSYTAGFANILLDETNGLNMIMFPSGWGDGCYASYWGYDANQQLCCIVTDFGLRD